MGGGGTSGGSTSQQAEATAPWQPQQSYQLGGLAQAETNLQNQQNLGDYNGQFVAGGNANTTGAYNYANNFANGAGSNLAAEEAGMGGSLTGYGSNYGANAEGGASALMNGGLYGTVNGYGSGQMSTAGASTPLSMALNESAINGAQGLQGFQQTLSQAANEGLANPTQEIEANAQNYANAPQVQQDVNATNQTIQNQLNTQTLPQLNQQEAAQGNLNSSRAGAAQGEAQLGAAQAEGMADASIENNALNTGMSTASGLYQSGLNTATSAGMFGYNDLANNANTQAAQQIGLNEYNTGTQLGAAEGGIGMGLNANGQVGNAASLGLNADQAAEGTAASNEGLLQNSGLLQQEMQQAGDTNAYDQWSQAENLPSQQLSQYWNVVGPNLGSSINNDTSQNYNQTTSSNMAGNIAGGIAGAVGLYNQYGQGLFGGNGNVQGTTTDGTNYTPVTTDQGLFAGAGNSVPYNYDSTGYFGFNGS